VVRLQSTAAQHFDHLVLATRGLGGRADGGMGAPGLQFAGDDPGVIGLVRSERMPDAPEGIAQMAPEEFLESHS
jgi:hypothetical protein